MNYKPMLFHRLHVKAPLEFLEGLYYKKNKGDMRTEKNATKSKKENKNIKNQVK